jgi:hypothetical protein
MAGQAMGFLYARQRVNFFLTPLFCSCPRDVAHFTDEDWKLVDRVRKAMTQVAKGLPKEHVRCTVQEAEGKPEAK